MKKILSFSLIVLCFSVFIHVQIDNVQGIVYTYLDSPNNTAIINDNTPRLQWGASGTTSLCRYQIDTVNTFDSPNQYNGTTIMHYVDIWFPLNETTYYWRVQSRDHAYVWGTYSSTWYFTVDITPPAIPVIASPASGISMCDDEPSLLWNDDVEVYRYQVQVSNSSDFSYLLVNPGDMLDNFYAFTDPLDEGKWFWRVRGKDYAGNYCNWTATYNFTVDTTAPAIPVLETPDNLAIIGENNPLLDWSSIDATLYQVQISSIMNFSTLEYNITTANSYYQIPTTLDDGVWYWRVRGKDDAGNWGYWSAIWWFKVETVVVPELPSIHLVAILTIASSIIVLLLYRKLRKK